MPSIDLSHVILNPSFSELLTVKRRTEVVGDDGIVSITFTIVNPAPAGVVLPGPKNDLERGEDYQSMKKMLSIHTPFRLRGPSPGCQPDIIVWRSNEFVVTKIEDFSNFGTGWVHAEAESINFIDQPPA